MIKTKWQSLVWRYQVSSIENLIQFCGSKIMCFVFWDRWGLLHVDFLPRGETIIAEQYYIISKVAQLKIKVLYSLSQGIVIFYKNTYVLSDTSRTVLGLGTAWSPFIQPWSHCFCVLVRRTNQLFLKSGFGGWCYGCDENVKKKLITLFWVTAFTSCTLF